MQFLRSISEFKNGVVLDGIIILGSILLGLIAGIPVKWIESPLDGIVLTATEIYLHNAVIGLVAGILGRYFSLSIVCVGGLAFGFSMSASIAVRGLLPTVQIVWAYAPVEFLAWFFILRAAFSATQFYKIRSIEGMAWVKSFVTLEFLGQGVLVLAAFLESQCV